MKKKAHNWYFHVESVVWKCVCNVYMLSCMKTEWSGVILGFLVLNFWLHCTACRMWDLSSLTREGLNSNSLEWTLRVLTSGQPGKSLNLLSIILLSPVNIRFFIFFGKMGICQGRHFCHISRNVYKWSQWHGSIFLSSNQIWLCLVSDLWGLP